MLHILFVFTPKYVIYQIIELFVTFSKGIGNPMSTLRYSLCVLSFGRSVTFSNSFLSPLIPFLVSRSNLLEKSISSNPPEAFSVIILNLSVFRILHMVEVDSGFFPLKMSFPIILLINVDFPELISPKR